MTALHGDVLPPRRGVRPPATLMTHARQSGLDALRRRIVTAFIPSETIPVDLLLDRVVGEAVSCFVATGADPTEAGRQMAARCRSLGEHQARLGADEDDLLGALHVARVAAQRGLAQAFDETISHDELTVVRELLVAYLQQLHGHTLAGLTWARRLAELPEQRRLDLLRDQLFVERRPRALATLAPLCGFDARGSLRPVVSVREPLEPALVDHPGTLAGHDEHEALVPVDWTRERVEALSPGPLVLGPGITLDRVPEAVALTRAAAAAHDLETSAEVHDVLGTLLTASLPLLGELLVDKHLDDLARLPPARRLNVAETLLYWLQSGLPVNGVARALGLPTQTAHSRVATARRIFGPVLEDPDTRLELTLALRTALPCWREDA